MTTWNCPLNNTCAWGHLMELDEEGWGYETGELCECGGKAAV